MYIFTHIHMHTHVYILKTGWPALVDLAPETPSPSEAELTTSQDLAATRKSSQLQLQGYIADVKEFVAMGKEAVKNIYVCIYV